MGRDVTARLLDGRAIGAEVLADLTGRIERLRADGAHPKLVFVMLGESEPARLYARRIHRLADRLQVITEYLHLPATVDQDTLLREVGSLDVDASVDGILVQMPLPLHLLGLDLSPALSPRKDVDGITTHNAGRLYLGLPGQRPSTAAAMMEMLRWAHVSATGRVVTVVGRSNVVGHPVAELLLQQDATVIVTHRQTRDLAHFTRQAEILIVAAGEPRLIRQDMVQPGVVVLDAGINMTPAGVVGDVDFASVQPIAAAITPVPGGVGPVTNAILLRSVVESAEQRGG